MQLAGQAVAHEASHTANTAIFVFVQTVDATECGTLLPTFNHRAIVSLLFGVLDHVDVVFVLSGLGDVAKQVPEGCAEPFGNRGQEDGFGRVHGLWVTSIMDSSEMAMERTG